MRILSVTIQNYRVHRQLTVDFDARLTVIGGANEAGKSTMVEAIHRAFFMKHKATGENLDEMKSLFGGHPEVRVTFDVDGRTCSIRKCFRGQSGSVVLEETGHAPLSGDAAEGRLAVLLGEEPVQRGWADSRWGHLWTWQARAFNNPTDCTNDRAADLVDRFQRNGAAVVQQSPLDARLSTRFDTLVAELFNKSGSAKKNSPLDMALERHTSAAREVQERRDALARLDEAVRRLAGAKATIEQTDVSILSRQQELAEVHQRQKQLAGLRNRAALEQKDADTAREASEKLTVREREIVQLRDDIQRLTERLAPMQQQAVQLMNEEESARAALATAEAQLLETDGRVRASSARARLADALVKCQELAGRRIALDERVLQVSSLVETVAQLAREIAALPPVHADTCNAIEGAARDRDVAHATLRAIATRVELLIANTDVRLGSLTLEIGTPQVITTDTELSVGGGTIVRITPGGGASLADAQQKADEANRRLEQLLQMVGVETAAEARRVHDQRVSLANALAVQEQKLAGLAPAEVEAERRTVADEIIEVDGDIRRRREFGAELPEPTSLADALSQRDSKHRLSAALDEQQQQLATLRDQARERVTTARDQRSVTLDSMAAQQEELNVLSSRAGSLLSVHGSDAARAFAVVEAEAIFNRRAEVMSATEQAIMALGPDLLDQEARMLRDSLENLERNRSTAQQERLLSGKELEQDGSRDPYAELALAESREQDTRAHLARVCTHADAMRELQTLYATEKEQLAEQYSQPLCDRVNHYLRVVMPDSGLHLRYDGSSFEEIGVERGTARLAFNALSTGAREQVATALRLGVAEVLAAGHGGSLPMVFDDAFAYSDPERLRRIRLMLYRAAQNGLQVIVLSCSPSDYDGLGTGVTLAQTALYEGDLRSVDDAATQGDEDVLAITSLPSVHGVSPIGAVNDEDITRFLETLRGLRGRAGNQLLQQALAWDDERYEVARAHLRSTGRITLGPGRGGSVKLVE